MSDPKELKAFLRENHRKVDQAMKDFKRYSQDFDNTIKEIMAGL